MNLLGPVASASVVTHVLRSLEDSHDGPQLGQTKRTFRFGTLLSLGGYRALSGAGNFPVSQKPNFLQQFLSLNPLHCHAR